MKKILSLLCVLTLMIGVIAVASVDASAAGTSNEVTAAKTMVDVKSGDKVSYVLNLGGVPERIIGAQFEVFYDSNLFDFDSVADFTDSTNQSDWQSIINPKLVGMISGNWSILKGVDFSNERHFLTLNLKAKAAGTGEISYFIYHMYGNSVFEEGGSQIQEYKFTCDVSVNGKPVLEDAQPQLNLDDKDTMGGFVNSLTGDSDDADASIPGSIAQKTVESMNPQSGKSVGSVSGGSGGQSAGAAGGSGSSKANNSAGSSATGAAEETEVVYATTAEGYYILETDAEGNVTATSDEPPVISGNGGGSGSGAALWIILGVIVLAGGGAAAYFYMKKKPGSDQPADDEKAKAAKAEEETAESAEPAKEEKTEVPEADGGEKTEVVKPADGEKTEAPASDDGEKTEVSEPEK